MTRCSNCEEMQVIDSTCQRCKDLNEFNELMEGTFLTPEESKELYGQGVSPEEKQGLTDNALIHHGGGDK